jgi:DNA polymerase-3 subunit alpha
VVAHPLDLDRLTFDDPKVFTMFQRGDTTGVFQFESGGMRRLLTDMKPDRLEDLIAANALFRPGPMDLIPDYNRRKHGTEQVPTVHDIVDRYTAETYGVMVYQEQVMQIVHGLGGIKLRDAYTLIKNISKKKHDKIEKERPKFVDGAQKQGLTKSGAEELFELILKFAGYGFNKSHSTGYAIVAYQTAYLKTYFPNQYMAAFLTYESQASAVADWVPYLEDCKKTRFIDPVSAKVVKTGVEVRPPDVNLSQADFSVVFGSSDNPAAMRAHQGHVRFGLNAIKGVSEKTIAAVIAERPKHGPYTSIFDFCERILAFGAKSGQTQVLNKGTLEALIKCGAFDSVHERINRAAMLATVEQAMQGAAKAAVDKAAGQNILFGGGGGGAGASAAQAPAPVTPLARATPWSEAETLAKEKESLGLYVSSHPLDAWRAWTGVFATADAAAIREKKHDDRVILAALVQSVRTIVTRNGASAGQKMAIVTAEDLTGVCEVVLFSEAYVRFSHLLEADKPLFVLGRVDTKRGGAQVIVERLVPIDGVPLQPGRLRVFFDDSRLNGSGPAAARKAAQMLADAMIAPPAEAPLFPLDLFVLAGERYARLDAPKFVRTPLTPDLIRGLEQTLGPGSVKLHAGVWVDTLEKRDKPWMKKKEGASVG